MFLYGGHSIQLFAVNTIPADAPPADAPTPWVARASAGMVLTVYDRQHVGLLQCKSDLLLLNKIQDMMQNVKTFLSLKQSNAVVILGSIAWKYICDFPSFIDTAVAYAAEMHHFETQGRITDSKYHGCWWLGYPTNQGISGHGVHLVLLCFSTRMFNTFGTTFYQRLTPSPSIIY